MIPNEFKPQTRWSTTHKVARFVQTKKYPSLDDQEGYCSFDYQATSITRRSKLNFIEFLTAPKMTAKLSMLGLPLGDSIRCKLFLGLCVSSANLSKPTVAFTKSLRISRAVSGSPLRKSVDVAAGMEWHCCCSTVGITIKPVRSFARSTLKSECQQDTFDLGCGENRYSGPHFFKPPSTQW